MIRADIESLTGTGQLMIVPSKEHTSAEMCSFCNAYTDYGAEITCVSYAADIFFYSAASPLVYVRPLPSVSIVSVCPSMIVPRMIPSAISVSTCFDR